jgi:hypothetical protein
MTAKEALKERVPAFLERVPELTEKQALRVLDVLEVAEVSRSTEHEDRVRRHRALMERADALRATQTEVVDAAALVDEAREEMEKRVS